MLRKKGRDTSVHHSSITEDDFKAIKQVLDPKTPEGLVNKVWFDVHLHFRRRGNEGNRQLKPSSFTTKTDENGLRRHGPAGPPLAIQLTLLCHWKLQEVTAPAGSPLAIQLALLCHSKLQDVAAPAGLP
ncbi:hypothetical protein F7725_009367 [Dissostichus mawsoni]|uniref:Uncharacterized protein n=1 Tax=Dissostichus mawsoni TaxID=36200 RepID=A0A7J5ZAX4_DISMA|nr:hypothetical protein F7725_009367 [Dissostichus mawsoni]